jgi:hypothetical protein
MATLGLGARGARADATGDAKDLFARGRALRQQGDCVAAVQAFRTAYALYPAGLGSLRNVAECEERLGHFASARRAWLDLKRALVGNDDRKYDSWSTDAEEAAAHLASKLATLVIEVEGPEPQVSVDGEPLDPKLLSTPLDRDPGRYTVRATAGHGGAAVEEAVDLVAGATRHVKLRPPVLAIATATGASTPGDPSISMATSTARPADTSAPPPATTAGRILVGVGAASLVGAGISLVIRQSAAGDLDDACPTHVGCSPSLQSTVDRGNTASVLFDVLGVAGVACVAGGVALVLTSRHAAPAAVSLSPSGLAVSGRF